MFYSYKHSRGDIGSSRDATCQKFKHEITNKMKIGLVICRCRKISYFFALTHFTVIQNLSKWQRAPQFADTSTDIKLKPIVE